MLVINQFGDHQMNMYFDYKTVDGHGGMMCEGEDGMESVFGNIKEIQKQSFEELGGAYIERGGKETTCAIRLPPSTFFEVILFHCFRLRITIWIDSLRGTEGVRSGGYGVRVNHWPKSLSAALTAPGVPSQD